ncbi:YqeG family HAD IIIA-type phosphatase [Lacticaseibacillus saniviri]|nr:YqeG family HAD IIIA-type phosphatase [Lacticaseibacillus saniviri]MCG4282037.1 YqeG family HAD IIIA-type phosphatase [Lacticaseibacillus saniviri]
MKKAKENPGAFRAKSRHFSYNELMQFYSKGGPVVSLIQPTWLVSAIYKITPEALKAQGIQVVLTDLDNTLIAWDNPDGTAELRQWLDAMNRAGITVMVVSNNNQQRVARALAAIKLPFVSRALKPLPVGIKKAIKHLHVNKDQVVMVGDQLLTDILAGNRAGIRTILVQPLVDTDAWNTRINRFFEQFAFKLVAKKQPVTYKEELDDHNRN